MQKRRRVALATLAAVLLLAGCGGKPAPSVPSTESRNTPQAPAAPQGSQQAAAKPATLTPVRVATISPDYLGAIPMVLALEKGYYKDEGLELKISYGNARPITTALIAGDYDIVQGTAPGIVAAMQGASVRTVIAVTEGVAWWIYGKPGVKTWADLKGKTVGLYSIGGGMNAKFNTLLTKNGVDPKDVKFVAPAPEDSTIFAFLRTGKIDAGVFTGVGVAKAEQEGFAQIGTFADILAIEGNFVTSKAFITKNQAALEAFARATVKGFRLAHEKPDEAVPILAKAQKLEEREAKLLFTQFVKLMTPYGRASDKAIQDSIGVNAQDMTEAPKTKNPADIFDFSYIEAARKAVEQSGWKP